MNADLRTVAAPGADIETQRFGDPRAPAILLVMGATASMLGWPDAFCAALAEGRRSVIRFDHRDTGRSTTVAPGAAAYAVEDMAADALAVIDAYDLGEAHLVGMSLGGFIAQMLAVERPERVASLTLIASEPLGWNGPPLPTIAPDILDHFSGLATLDWTDAAAVEDFLLATERFCAGSGAPLDLRTARARIRAALARSASPASMFNHAALALRDDWTGRFRDIAKPTLVVHGAEDPVLPPANGAAIAEAVPGARLVLLPGVGHELPPRAVPRIVGEILALTEAASQALKGQRGRA